MDTRPVLRSLVPVENASCYVAQQVGPGYYRPIVSNAWVSERYALLVRQLGEDRGFLRGWKSEVAKILDVHPSYVAKVHSGERSVIGLDRIEHAIKELSLDPEWFYSYPDHFEMNLEKKPRWNDWVRTPREASFEPETFTMELEPVHDSPKTLVWLNPLLECVRTEQSVPSRRLEARRKLAEEILRIPVFRLAQQVLTTDEPEKAASLGMELKMQVQSIAMAMSHEDERERAAYAAEFANRNATVRD